MRILKMAVLSVVFLAACRKYDPPAVGRVDIHDTDQFERLVLREKRPAAVMFVSADSAPCRFARPVMDALATQIPARVVLAVVDLSDLRVAGLEAQYNVNAVPTVVLWNQGSEIERLIGVPREDLLISLIRERLLKE